MATGLVSIQHLEEASAVGQLGKQGQMVVHQPVVESRLPTPYSGVERTNSSDLAEEKTSLRVFGQAWHLVI